MTSDFFLNLRSRDEVTVDIDIAFFSRPFSFRNVPTNAFPLIFSSVLARAPNLEVALVL